MSYRIRVCDPATGAVLNSNFAWHRSDHDAPVYSREFSERKLADEFALELQRERPEIEIWMDDVEKDTSTRIYSGNGAGTPKRDGARLYSLANLACLGLLMAVALCMIHIFLLPFGWLWLIIVPLAFFGLGFLQERILSGVVNNAVRNRIERQCEQSVPPKSDRAGG